MTYPRMEVNEIKNRKLFTEKVLFKKLNLLMEELRFLCIFLYENSHPYYNHFLQSCISSSFPKRLWNDFFLLTPAMQNFTVISFKSATVMILLVEIYFIVN